MKVSARLPDDLVRELDELVEAGAFPDRTAAMAHALRLFVRYRAGQMIDAAYIAAYTALPETDEERSAAEAAGRRAIAEDAW
jgi:Arc/MetJ-type ribon-helix-helix transcriptional regulator